MVVIKKCVFFICLHYKSVHLYCTTWPNRNTTGLCASCLFSGITNIPIVDIILPLSVSQIVCIVNSTWRTRLTSRYVLPSGVQ